MVSWSEGISCLILFWVWGTGFKAGPCFADEGDICDVAVVVCEPGYRLKAGALKQQPWTTLVILTGKVSRVGRYQACIPSSGDWRHVTNADRSLSDLSLFGSAAETADKEYDPAVFYYTSPGTLLRESSSAISSISLRGSHLHGFLIPLPEAVIRKEILQQVSYVSDVLDDEPLKVTGVVKQGYHSFGGLFGAGRFKLLSAGGYRFVQRVHKDRLTNEKLKLIVSIDRKPFIKAWEQINQEHNYCVTSTKQQKPEQDQQSTLATRLRPRYPLKL